MAAHRYTLETIAAIQVWIGFGYRNRGAQTRTTAADNHDVRRSSRWFTLSNAAVLVLQHLAVVNDRAYPGMDPSW